MTDETNKTETNMETNTTPTPAAPATTEAATPVVDVTPAAPVVAETPAAPAVAATPATPAPAAVAATPAKKADVLKIPAGSFTHTDLARANSKTNQQVWTRYQALVKSGTIIRDGERKPAGGKGKPSLLWKLNPNGPNPVPTAPAPVTPVAAVPATPAIEAADGNVVLPTEAQMEAAADAAPEPPKDNEPPQGGTPVAAADTATVTIEVARVEAPALPTTPEAQPPVVEPVAGIAAPVAAETITEQCPACQHNLSAAADATGVMVGCDQPKAVCPTAERVEGHGTTVKGAIATLHDKWDKLVAAMKQPVAV